MRGGYTSYLFECVISENIQHFFGVIGKQSEERDNFLHIAYVVVVLDRGHPRGRGRLLTGQIPPCRSLLLIPPCS